MQMVSCFQHVQCRLVAQVGLYHYALKLRLVVLRIMLPQHVAAGVALWIPGGDHIYGVLDVWRSWRVSAEAESVA